MGQAGKHTETADNNTDSKMSRKVIGEVLSKGVRYDRAEAHFHIDLPSSMKKNDMQCIAPIAPVIHI